MSNLPPCCRRTTSRLVRSRWLGTNLIPADCNLLIIGGPTTPLPDEELEKIDQYLNQGGRLAGSFNFLSISGPADRAGKVLAKWGVDVTRNVVSTGQHDHGIGYHCSEVQLTTRWSIRCWTLRLHMILPRASASCVPRAQPVDAPQVDEIAFSGPKRRD